MKQLKGVHHVTAITSSAEKIYDFFTVVLGMRLVKKTVNQDDIHTYHLFFADDKGSAGTDMTFFDFPGMTKGVHGKNEISKTSFRVPSDAALVYWQERFDQFKVVTSGIQERFGKKSLSFADFDDQQYQLISDELNQGVASGTPWQKGPVPIEYAITGLGPVFIRIANIEALKAMLVTALKFRETAHEGPFHLFETGEGGNGASVIVEHNKELPDARQGYGTVHHAAFRVEDKTELEQWIDWLDKLRLPNSGFVDRFFFQSLYARVSPQILFEMATDGPGFMGDESYETLGEKLSLPPFLEPQRAEIERTVRPIYTVRSTKEHLKQ
ncbi:MAG TPA: ring-cleaving dioxygenase [Flavitalea sp.]|nr:ring-cleaving dioxygenase [Flavitalea sp.]